MTFISMLIATSKPSTFVPEMKKIIIAIMAFLYLGVSSGIAMEIHYCMGKKAGVDFYGGGNDKCGRCGMTEKNNGCCHDQHKFYKLNDAHKTVSNDLSFETPVAVISNHFRIYVAGIVANPLDITICNLSPPDDPGPGACIMNCTFRL